MFKIGDKVSVIHETIAGTILTIAGAKVTIEDTDGFVRAYKITDIVKETNDEYVIHEALVTESIHEKDSNAKPAISRKSSTETTVEYTNPNEIDLHIEVLFPEAVHWSVADILQKQMIACRAFVEKAIANKSRKVVVIHGKGEGVLKSEIYRYLNRVQNHLHISISYHDADFRTFGTGATQINFTY